MYYNVIILLNLLFGITLLGMTSDTFLLVADPCQECFYQINLANDSVWKLPLSHSDISHVTYDPSETKIYWKSGQSIDSAHLDGTMQERISGLSFYNLLITICVCIYNDIYDGGILTDLNVWRKKMYLNISLYFSCWW